MVDTTTFKEQLATQFYAPISVGITREGFERAASVYLEYLRLPREVKRSMHYDTGRDRETPDGYNEKTLEEDKDPKEFFHWTPRIKDNADYAHKYRVIPEVRAFGDVAEDLYRKVERFANDFFDNVYPEYKQHVFDEHDRLPNSILRFLSYRPKPDNNFCAKPHYDKGYGTFALAESAPGLRIGCCNDHALHSVKHSTGTTLFMPAWKLFEASGGSIKPAWHDVIQDVHEQNVNDICARWAIVFFLNGTSYAPREVVHVPLH